MTTLGVSPPPPAWGLAELVVEGFRTLHRATLRPGRLCALVGEANAGKSNVLAAIRALLDPEAAPLRPEDASEPGRDIHIRGLLADGTALSVSSRRDGHSGATAGEATVMFLPAALRSTEVMAPSTPRHRDAERAAAILAEVIPASVPSGEPGSSSAGAARGLVRALEACLEEGISGCVLLIEEPELFLPPQTGRYLYRVLHRLADRGNQVVYSTHSPAFLNVAHLEELVFAEREPDHGTVLFQPEPLESDETFRASSEFDAERSELFLSRATVLVEGITEKIVLPYVFGALGHDADRERISVVEVGGKSKMPLFVRICQAARVPFVAVHDRDAAEGEEPNDEERQLNDLIAGLAGPDRIVVLVPDFESVAGLSGRKDKPARAWRRFREMEADEVPQALAAVVERALALASRDA